MTVNYSIMVWVCNELINVYDVAVWSINHVSVLCFFPTLYSTHVLYAKCTTRHQNNKEIQLCKIETINYYAIQFSDHTRCSFSGDLEWK